MAFWTNNYIGFISDISMQSGKLTFTLATFNDGKLLDRIKHLEFKGKKKVLKKVTKEMFTKFKVKKNLNKKERARIQGSIIHCTVRTDKHGKDNIIEIR